MIILLRGPQGCGKSTLASMFNSDTVVSSDAFRVMLAGDPVYQKMNKRVFELLHEVVDTRTSLGLTTVVDATNATPSSVTPFKNIALKYGVPIHVIDFQIYDVDYLMGNICRRAEGGGLYVPREVVQKTVEKLASTSVMVQKMVDGFHVVDDKTTHGDLVKMMNIVMNHCSMSKVHHVNDNFWAVGDIHGCLKTFDALLKTLEEKGAEDVVLLGDYVDRGPDSVGVLARIARRNVPFRLHAIKGNHDLSLYRELKFGTVCNSESRAKTHEEIHECGAASAVIDAIERMPHVMVFKHAENGISVIATHAGLEHVSRYQPNQYTASTRVAGRQLSEDEKKFLHSLNEQQNIIQVFGHRYVDFTEEINPWMANIDSGAVYGKWLTAYNPFTREVVKQPLIDEVNLSDTNGENNE